MKAQQQLLAFNRGTVSPLALGRLDLKRLAMASEEQTNWMPSSLGPMSLRPGLGYIGTTNGFCYTVPFVFSIDEAAILEFSDETLRIWVDDELIAREAVTATITNGTFTTDLTGWTDSDESAASSTWQTGGYLGLLGTGTSAAIREQAVSITETNEPHALRIVVDRGPVILRVGTTTLGSELLSETSLGAGTHSIVVTPTTATMYVQLLNRLPRRMRVDSIEIEGAGTLELTTPYTEDDVRHLRHVQSGDVVYLACSGDFQQRKVERRANGSWSIVQYQPTDGPFMVENVTGTTITPSGNTGSVTLTASAPVWDADHVGALWSINSVGQRVTVTGSSNGVTTASIRVTGIDSERVFSVDITGNATASTVTLQRSYDDVTWAATATTYTTNTTTTYDDTLDNQIVYYRLELTTRVAPDNVVMTLRIGSGSIRGIARLTAYTSSTVVTADVLSQLGGTDASSLWAEGLWSDFRGWPSSTTIHDGRLWWMGKDRFVGSITDAYESFDPDYEGDAGPIVRTIGSGPVDSINWALSLSRLLVGTDMAEIACRSSSFDEPLTPTNFTPKRVGTQGVANVAALEIDNTGVFVQRGGQRAYQLLFSIDQQDYSEVDLTALCPAFLSPGVVSMDVQRQPDTRVHFVREDGTVGVLVVDRNENLLCWVNVETDGDVEDVVVLPGTEEDIVYYVVKRVIGGTTVRYLERWAMESECVGGQQNKQADSFVTVTNSSSVAAAHLDGEEVVVWADGEDRGTVTVTGGVASLGALYVTGTVGLSYEARFKSTKLAYLVPEGVSALGAKKKIHKLGLVTANTHTQGVEYGPDFTTMDDLPLVEEGTDIDDEAVEAAYEYESFTFPGNWTTDARLCLRATAPRPATVMAAIVDMSTNP